MKENYSPSFNQQPKKQVRFNTSLKMASSASDHQLPRPLTDIQNTNNAERRCDSYEPTFNSNVSQNKTPSAYFDKDCVINLPSRKFDPESTKLIANGQNLSLPKPSDDLELSILDSSDAFKGNNGLVNNYKMNGLAGKIYENDTPYCFAPSKMPLQSVYNQTQSEKLFNLTPGLMSSAAQSTKDFHTDKSDSNPGLGFFTLPNSAGLYQDKKSMATPTVAAAKNNLMNQSTIHLEPNFGNKRDFNVVSHNSATLRQFGADKTNVGFISQGQNTIGFNAQGQNANGFSSQGRNANGFSAREQNSNGFSSQGRNANGFSAQGQNANGFSPQGQNTNGFGLERHNANGLSPQIGPNSFRTQGQNEAHGFSSQRQNVQGFSSEGHMQAYGSNSQGLKTYGAQAHYREDNVQMHNCNVNARMPNNHNVIFQTEHGQTYERCLQNDPNDYCCPRNVNTRRACCNQRDCDTNYEAVLANKTGMITNGLEMKQKAMEAREKGAKGSKNILQEIEKCNNDKENVLTCSKNGSEPTVSDLYEIIKLQNKQLQMLQNRVDRLLTVNEAKISDRELPDTRQKQVLSNGRSNDCKLPQADINVNCIEHISIGVMTSFELVMSSNYVNKRNVTFNPEAINNQDNRRDECAQTTPNNSNSKLQRNQSVHSDASPIAECGGNFLDGIARCNKACDPDGSASKTPKKQAMDDDGRKMSAFDDTVQTDDQVTPKMNNLNCKTRTRVVRNETPPIAEYDEECFNETEPNECSQPNVGWTFYNNVMNRVNNMLSPPNANNTSPNVVPRRQITMEQNQQVASTQRVTYDTPSREVPLQFSRPSSDLSLHMSQLAAKYNVSSKAVNANSRPVPTSAQPLAYANANRLAPSNACQAFGDARNEMSFATMQYMQRYQLLSMSNDQPQVAVDRGNGNYANHRPRPHLKPVYNNPSRILDITTLKQQSKLL